MEKDSVKPTEIETTLIICSEDPETVVEEIADIKTILNYQLFPNENKKIHDWYWDTEDNSLLKNRLSLRFREVNSKQLITLKGDAKISNWGGIERLEIELPWSKEGLLQILNEIKEKGVIRNPMSDRLDFDQPILVFKELGFELVQNRETKRRIRNFVIKNREQVLAELAIDFVRYKIGNKPVHHFELEIESKHENGIKVLRTCSEYLCKKYSKTLHKWKHSKLTTGKALENLLKKEPRETVVSTFNNVLPSTYKKLTEFLNIMIYNFCK